MTEVNLMQGDCLVKMKELADNSVDSIVTDPPYGISFMGKGWDHSVPSKEVWAEAFRVLKPGGYLLAFAGTRTQHRMAVNIEDAGFEIRDMIAWVYGSGFPKSMDVSKAIDKSAGAEREVIGISPNHRPNSPQNQKDSDKEWFQDRSSGLITTHATDDAKKWEGWGTALKPALEPITVARKPLSEKTVAANVLKYGTGAINIDESRVIASAEDIEEMSGRSGKSSENKVYGKGIGQDGVWEVNNRGRFPANFIHDGSEEVTSLFPNSKSCSTPSNAKPEGTIFGGSRSQGAIYPGEDGSAARFFYVPKTSKKDRNEGLENNNHPTVKPTELMQYLVRMVTPKGGTTMDPFMGSGSTGKAAKLEGFNFIGIELDPDYLEIAKARIDAVSKPTTLEDYFK